MCTTPVRTSSFFFGMVLVAGLLWNASAFAEIYGPIEIKVEPQPAAESSVTEDKSDGYIEYRISIQNSSTTQDYLVRLEQSDPYRSYNTDYLQRNSRSVKVPRGTSVKVSLFQPLFEGYGRSLEVSINGNPQEGRIPLSNPLDFSRSYSSTNASGAVLVSRGISQELKDRVRAEFGESQIAFCRSELGVAQWSPNWLGYTGYNAILITESEAASLPAEVVQAIRRYVEVGGTFLIEPAGDRSAINWPAGLIDGTRSPDEDGSNSVGFGIVAPCPESAPWPAYLWAPRGMTETAPSDPDVRVDSQSNVPVRSLLTLVILFAVGIGPLNIWLLSRARKKMWLWWNVPAISLATCFLVFAYSLASEGVRGRGKSAIFTLLDEQNHRATSFGYVSYYCPLTPSDGLHFSYDTAVNRLDNVTHQRWNRTSGRPKTIDWTVDQHLDSGWIFSRIPSCFSVRKSENRRERLVFHKSEQGEVSVVNGLGVTIDSLFYLDEKGTLRTASDIGDGAEKKLSTEQRDLPDVGETLLFRRLYLSSWEQTIKDAQETPEKTLTPGTYVALVKTNPFLEDPLPGTPQSGNVGIIYGSGAGVTNGN